MLKMFEILQIWCKILQIIQIHITQAKQCVVCFFFSITLHSVASASMCKSNRFCITSLMPRSDLLFNTLQCVASYIDTLNTEFTQKIAKKRPIPVQILQIRIT